MTALDTGRVVEAAVLRRSDEGIEAAVLVAQDAEAVRALTALDAAAAEDTFGCIADQTGRELVDMYLRVHAAEHIGAGAGNIGHVEQFAFSVFVTRLTELVMVGQKELDAHSSGCGCSGRGDRDLHAVGYRVDAAGYEAARALYFDQADTTGSLVAFSVVKRAERRDLVSAFSGGFQDRQTFFDLMADAFDFDRNKCHDLSSYSFVIAINLQLLLHRPHFAHFDWSIAKEASLWPSAM